MTYAFCRQSAQQFVLYFRLDSGYSHEKGIEDRGQTQASFC